MKTVVKSVARALVEVARLTPKEQYHDLVEGALLLLRKYHCHHSDFRRFFKVVEVYWQEQEGIIPVTLSTTSEKVGDAQEIVVGLERLLGKRVKVSERRDPSLIGGLKLMFGDERIDASLNGRLLQLKNYLCSPLPPLS